MGAKSNCWEVMRCGREPDGEHAGDKGVCPAAVEERLDGENSGTNAGRTCWVVAGTFCGGEVQGEFAHKAAGCRSCEFYKMVQGQEGSAYTFTSSLLTKLQREA